MEKLNIWPLMKAEKPLIIAGPCSAETEEQVLETARQLKTKGVDIFRAGIWKPRTRPGSFEGIGTIGLKWLKRVQEETGLPVATEVANTRHVEETLKNGVDVLWIGARTTANPFAVQEIADALKGVDIPVLVKNPVNPDIQLWMGAIERLEKAGIYKVGAIHRGVSQFEKSIYRNNPEWQMPLKLKKLRQDILMINDPSHIAGNRQLLSNIAQIALDLNFDGLMIEAHIDPDNALTDAQQQITPTEMELLIHQLTKPGIVISGTISSNIEKMRNIIDYLDDQLIDLLSFRMKVAVEIGEYKKKNNLPVLQENRWKELLLKNAEKGVQKNLSKAFVASLFNAIHQESLHKQNRILKKLK